LKVVEEEKGGVTRILALKETVRIKSELEGSLRRRRKAEEEEEEEEEEIQVP